MNHKVTLGILKSFPQIDPLIESYCNACKQLGVDYVILDLLADTWIADIKRANIDGLLVRVKGNIPEHKSFFDERLYIIDEELRIPIYPSRKELYLYENKRLYAYWLEAHHFPHVKTCVFYERKSALEYINKAALPVVFKTSGGASSSGVDIVNSRFKAKRIINQVFGRLEPRLTLGKIPWARVGLLPVPKLGQIQKHYVIVQEYIPIKWEWRIIKIGNSYSGHQKLLKGQYASGSKLVGWVEPPRELLLMIKDLCEKGNFDSMDMDVFESTDGKYYINEIQSLYGSFLPYQMKINGVPGRFIYQNDEFIFEEGEFYGCNSNLLRVEDFLNKIKSNYYNRASETVSL